MLHGSQLRTFVNYLKCDGCLPVEIGLILIVMAIQPRPSRRSDWEPTPGDFSPWGAYRQFVGHVQVHPTEPGHLFATPFAGGLFENQLTN